MERALRQRIEAFLRPLYQDLDGVSRFDEVERIAAIARRLYAPPPDEERSFELLLLFSRLGKWLDKVGNVSRTALALDGVGEAELRSTAVSIRRINDETPRSAAERAVAAAVLIDGAGVRGLLEHFGRAKREGSSLMDVVRAALSDVSVPEWLSPQAVAWLHARREARREVCRRLLEELAMEDF